jgi:uncharacterized protein (DUF488 family)
MRGDDAVDHRALDPNTGGVRYRVTGARDRSTGGRFDEEVLAAELPSTGITYQGLGKLLGGRRRKTLADSPHTTLRSAGFRNYADDMETEDFQQGVDKLLKLAENRRIAYMCAERLWWRCHRSLISDYLTAIRGVEVIHIHDEKKSEPHRLHRTARVEEGHLVYDVGESGRLL